MRVQDPKVTSPSRDVNKDGGRVNDFKPIINMQAIYLICKFMQIKLIGLINMQIISAISNMAANTAFLNF
jgi:hypothetical protein